MCWKQFWSNSTSRVRGRPRGMRMLELLGVRPRPVHPNQCGSLKDMTWPVGRERSQKIPLERALESSLKGSDDTLFYCGEFLYSSINPAYCKLLQRSEGALWALLRVLPPQLNLSYHKKFLVYCSWIPCIFTVGVRVQRGFIFIIALDPQDVR